MKETNKILVDIESLFDIRQAMLSKLTNIDNLVNLVNSEEYNHRKVDIFKDIDMAEYEKINNNKTVDLLQRSTVTYIINVLKSKVQTLEKRNNFYGETKAPEIILNIHPFNLSEEQVNVLQNLLFVKLDSKCLITIISKSNAELTPHFIKSLSIIVCIIYNFSEWLSHNTDALNTIKLPDVLFYFPSVYKIEDTNNEMEKITKQGFKDVFSYLEFLLSSVANINFLPILFYSNLITASILVDQYNDELKNVSLGDDDGDISTEV